MMKSNIIPFNESCVTVQNVLDAVTARADISEIYIVTKNLDGKFGMYGSGDLSDISAAALYFLKNASNSVMDKQELIDEE